VQANSANYGFNIITKYPRADFICLDEVELRLAMHDKYTELPKLLKKVSRQLDAMMSIVTRGSDGSIVYEKSSGISYSPALATSVIDAVGAGDAFFAIASPLAAVGADASLVAFIGNVAGAIKVQTIGNKHAIDEDDLRGFIIRLLR
jgi:bifunctional ADP-heptose synthase (sugar kinase/adenylyltransferase)